MSKHKFTLAEVLVALIISAVLVPVVLQAFLIVGGLNESAARERLAARLADLKLSEIVVDGDLARQIASGSFGDDYPDYTWDLQELEWYDDITMMRQLELTVRWPGRRGNPASLTLVTLVPEVMQ